MKDNVVVWMNDKAVYWRKSQGPIDVAPKVEILANVIGSSAMRSSFQGVLWDERRDPPPSWHKGPFKTLDLYLGGRGEGSQPLVATGPTGRADTLAIVWLPDNKARLVYDHWGSGSFTSRNFAWDADQLHHLQVEAPSFGTLDKPVQGDGKAKLRVTVDGHAVVDDPVEYFDAPSSTFYFGKNVAGSSVAGSSLDLYLGDIRQVD
jgi:hypothetical protein